MTNSNTLASSGVQLFNESVLRSSPTDRIPVLLPTSDVDWAPNQVVLDYRDDACYGATVHYERSKSFERLRGAINSRFKKYEDDTFAKDTEIGIWRNEDAQFAIQLSANDENESYIAIYICFVDIATVASGLKRLKKH